MLSAHELSAHELSYRWSVWGGGGGGGGSYGGPLIYPPRRFCAVSRQFLYAATCLLSSSYKAPRVSEPYGDCVGRKLAGEWSPGLARTDRPRLPQLVPTHYTWPDRYMAPITSHPSKGQTSVVCVLQFAALMHAASPNLSACAN